MEEFYYKASFQSNALPHRPTQDESGVSIFQMWFLFIFLNQDIYCIDRCFKIRIETKGCPLSVFTR